jgi:hypothetical protein
MWGAVEIVSRQQRNLGAFFIRKNSDAVVFLLKDPTGPIEGCWYEECQHRTHADGNAVDHKNLLYRFRKAFSVVLITYSTCRFRLPFLLRSRPLSTVEQLILDLFKGQSTAGGVFRPRHIGAMKIAGINRIIVKLFEWPDPDTHAPMPYVCLLVLYRFALVLVLLRDADNELSGLRINTSCFARQLDRNSSVQLDSCGFSSHNHASRDHDPAPTLIRKSKLIVIAKSVLASLTMNQKALSGTEQFWDLGRRDCGQDYDQERNAGNLCEQADQYEQTTSDFEASYKMRGEVGVWESNLREAENAHVRVDVFEEALRQKD